VDYHRGLGWLDRQHVDRPCEGLIGDIIIGILGALVGGFLYGVLAHREFVAHFNLGTLLVAVVGAALLQLVFAALRAQT
jgi:uncharacterized membrane protein YeaQ/YmgE (transglycosylase-associated protein family)